MDGVVTGWSGAARRRGTLQGDRRRPADVKALRQIDPQLAQQLQRGRVLDALGDRALAEAAASATTPETTARERSFTSRSRTKSMSIFR